MNKPSNYDEVSAVNMGEYETLEPGGYICTVKKAAIEKSQKGNEMLVLLFDIHEGDMKGFYDRQFKEDTRQDKKWKGILRQVTDGNSTKFFKGIIKSIEESNSGFKFDFDEKKLVGKIFGGLFGREEFFSVGKGDYSFSTKIRYVRSVEAIKSGKFEIPKDILADRSKTSNSAPDGFFAGNGTVVDDDDLPF